MRLKKNNIRLAEFGFGESGFGNMERDLGCIYYYIYEWVLFKAYSPIDKLKW